MENKIIIYLGNFGRPEKNAAGKRVYGNTLLFNKLGYRVILIGKSKNDEESNDPIKYGDNIEFYSFPKCSLYKTSVFIDYVSKVIKKVGVPGYIIRYGSPGLAEFDRRLLSFCKNRKIKLIADVVDWLPSGGDNIFFNFIKGTDTFLEKGIYNRRSDGIIAISSYLSDYYYQRGCRTVVIPPIVEDYSENNGDNSAIRVVYAGIPFRMGRKIKSPAEVKDRLDLAVRGIARVIKRGVCVDFDIYGITKEQYLTAYPKDKQIIQEINEIRFHGKESMEFVQDAVNCADFTILLRDRNRATMAGFPTKVVESISCGTPVITTNTSDLDKYILNERTGFIIESKGEENIVDELEEILGCDKSLLKTMKKYCFESRQFCYEKYEEAIKGFIAGL
ncbi:glycosyltransferase [Roseburia hominis]